MYGLILNHLLFNHQNIWTGLNKPAEMTFSPGLFLIQSFIFYFVLFMFFILFHLNGIFKNFLTCIMMQMTVK